MMHHNFIFKTVIYLYAVFVFVLKLLSFDFSRVEYQMGKTLYKC